jgi:hypothetical protein
MRKQKKISWFVNLINAFNNKLIFFIYTKVTTL